MHATEGLRQVRHSLINQDPPSGGVYVLLQKQVFLRRHGISREYARAHGSGGAAQPGRWGCAALLGNGRRHTEHERGVCVLEDARCPQGQVVSDELDVLSGRG
eukprot:COSAG02_NODE_2257_length_9341_cov_13.355118_7_plen_103_part_00